MQSALKFVGGVVSLPKREINDRPVLEHWGLSTTYNPHDSAHLAGLGRALGEFIEV
jgi:hypothetical protein